jgi:hypothetical protein
MTDNEFNKLSGRLYDAGGEIYEGTTYRLRKGDAILYVELSIDGRHYTKLGVYVGQGKEEVISLGELTFKDVCHLARIVLGVVL